MTRYVLMLVLIAPVVAADEITDAPGVRGMCWHLLSQVRFGFDHAEAAAFVVRSDDGYRCVAWPSDGLVDSARWEGQFPIGTLAIIHTHPNWMSSPSTIDIHTARTTGVPVYVVTRTKITKTEGDGSEVVVSGNWKPDAPDREIKALRLRSCE